LSEPDYNPDHIVVYLQGVSRSGSLFPPPSPPDGLAH
jgi:hypothetical protein